MRLLGPVQLWAGDRQVDLGPARQRTVLAALAVDAGTPVPLDTLIGRVWDENPPAGARSGLYSYLTRIRRALAQVEPRPGLHVRSGGYVLELDPDAVDLHRFRHLTERARQLPDDGRADVLAEALALWTGPALADLSSGWAVGVRTHLTHQRLDALLAWAGAELRRNRPDAVIAALREQLTEHPLVEPLAARLMQALYLQGRGAEALSLYAGVRERFVDELGAEPGPDLRRVHEAILRDEPTPAPTETRATVPMQLPMMPAAFAARERELEALDGLARRVDERTTTVVVSAVHGTAGVGKTTLALHWGHRAARLFPDGQLYVNLRGFDPGGRAMDPADALRRFLESLGVSASGVPADPEARAALFRSRLAGRRMLIVLDNARDVAQVRPLLPGAPGCLVLVTSRNQLTGLVAADGAVPVSLDLLTPDESRRLLAGRIGVERATAEPAALEEIVARCVGLPLALAVVAARAITRPRTSLATLAAELRTVDSGLTALAGGDDEYTDVRAVFSWSYRALSPPAAELFALFGLHPGPDVTAAALASMAARPMAEVGALLTELTRANLVGETTAGRYGCHDLLRAYAAELAGQSDSGDATLRMLDHYLATGFAAAMVLDPLRKPIEVAPLAVGVAPENVDGHEEARAWFAVERPVLLAAVNRAVETGHDVHVWQLAWTLNHILDFGGHWQEYAAVAEAAVAAAERLGDDDAESRTLRNLGVAYINSDQYEQGEKVLERALELTSRMGDDYAQAYVHRFMAAAVGQQERHADAIEHARQSLALFEPAGNMRGVALALNAIGWHRAQLGEFTEALEPCQRALEIFRGLDDLNNVAHTLDSVGYIHHHLGRYAEAVEDFREAATLLRRLANQRYEATTLVKLGETYRCLGDLDAARATWTEAVRILAELGVPEVEDARAKLAALG
jgi:DNA-binding SARP family transcriptional activator/tetratricopeptide (TPR) repeat protein